MTETRYTLQVFEDASQDWALYGDDYEKCESLHKILKLVHETRSFGNVYDRSRIIVEKVEEVTKYETVSKEVIGDE